MNLQFVNGWALFLLWAVLALAPIWLLLYRRRRKSLENFLAEPMLKKLAPSIKPARFYWQVVLVQAGLLLLLIAAARPQWGMEERTVFQRGRDLIIALDVSRSMLARDVHPNRLQRAKADIQDLLRELRGDRVALLTFRGHAVQLCPLTTDYAYLEQILDDVTVESAPRGETNIGDAIEKALTAFESDDGAHRAMILISDGEDLVGQAKSAAEKARAKGVVIFTVGLGDPKGANIPGASKDDPHLTYQGKEVITRLQHETLKEIAEITGGAYVPVGVANVKLGELYREHLSKIAARDIEESLQKRMIERYQLFLFPGMLALLAGALLSRGRLAVRKKAMELSGQTVKASFRKPLSSTTAAKLLLCFLFSTLIFHGRLTAQINTIKDQSKNVRLTPSQRAEALSNATAVIPANTVSNMSPALKDTDALIKALPTGRQGASRAQTLYRQGKYRQSALAYLHAMSNSTPRLQQNCLFNAGCAFYQGKDYASAAESFNQLGNKENTDQSKVYYNLGCATYRIAEQSEKKDTNRPPEIKPMLLEKAGHAFQRSLRVNPDYKNASANLAVITNMLPKAREDAKLQTLMAKYGNQPPPQLADTMLANQRNIIKALPEALTNATPARIAQFENLAEQQRANSDLLIPLKMTLLNAMSAQGPTGQKQIPQLEQHLEAIRNSMTEGFNDLRNIDNRSFHPAKAAERGVYNLWKGLAPFEKLLNEDIRRQTNTITMTTSVLADTEGEIEAIQAEQKEARQLTQLFLERFAQAVPPKGTPASRRLPGNPTAPLPAEGTETPSTNNTPQISPETRTNILSLADQAIKTQARASQFMTVTNLGASLPEQRRSYDLLKEIERLLPKDKNQQQDQQKQQNDQKQDQNQKQDKQQPPQQEQPPPPPKEQEQQPPPPQQEQQPQKPKEQPAPPEQKEQKDQKEMTPEQLKSLLEKALQREKEHREDKMRDEYVPPSPVERDW